MWARCDICDALHELLDGLHCYDSFVAVCLVGKHFPGSGTDCCRCRGTLHCLPTETKHSWTWCCNRSRVGLPRCASSRPNPSTTTVAIPSWPRSCGTSISSNCGCCAHWTSMCVGCTTPTLAKKLDGLIDAPPNTKPVKDGHLQIRVDTCKASGSTPAASGLAPTPAAPSASVPSPAAPSAAVAKTSASGCSPPSVPSAGASKRKLPDLQPGKTLWEVGDVKAWLPSVPGIRASLESA